MSALQSSSGPGLIPPSKLAYIMQQRHDSRSTNCHTPGRPVGFVGIGKTGSLFVQAVLELFAHESLLPTLHPESAIRARAVGAEMGWHHASALLWQRAFGSSVWSGAFTFSLVRDPWARLVSHWAFHMRSRSPLDAGYLTISQRMEAAANETHSITLFRAWVRHVRQLHPPDRPGAWHFTSASGHGNEQARGYNASQLSWLVGEDGVLLVDRVYKLEELEGRWAELQGHVCGLRGTTYREALHHPAVVALDHPSKHAPFADYYDEPTSQIVGEYMAADIERFGYRPPTLATTATLPTQPLGHGG